jgi:hypothetical protein
MKGITMVKTMAVKITPETYPIAVACLAGGFAMIPLKRVIGAYLVINELQARRLKGERSPALVLGNGWMSKETLMRSWFFVGEKQKNGFREIHQR